MIIVAFLAILLLSGSVGCLLYAVVRLDHRVNALEAKSPTTMSPEAARYWTSANPHSHIREHPRPVSGCGACASVAEADRVLWSREPS